jgi:hypothetical protein
MVEVIIKYPRFTPQIMLPPPLHQSLSQLIESSSLTLTETEKA